jgi:hypothetical protein
VHFGVLFIEEYRYGEKTFHHTGNVKFCPRTGNPPTAYQHLYLASSRTGEKSPDWAEVICLHQGYNSGDFPQKKANFRILIKNFLGIFPTKKQILGFLSKTFWAFFRTIYGLLKR